MWSDVYQHIGWIPTVQANHQAIFSYTLVDFVTVEIQTANIDFTFYGTGHWYDSQLIKTS